MEMERKVCCVDRIIRPHDTKGEKEANGNVGEQASNQIWASKRLNVYVGVLLLLLLSQVKCNGMMY